MTDAFRPVTLVDPDGKDYIASDAAELNNLIYGRGYRLKDNKTVEEVTGHRSSKDSPKLEKSSPHE